MSVKLSVIVPTHNSEKYIRECIESIIHQTYDNLEILCVDSSKDSTLSLLQEFAQRDCRVRIIQDANSSYGHKINVGIQQAQGEYIGIVESDDYILPNMYQNMFAKLGQEKVDFIKSNALHFCTINGRRAFCKTKWLERDMQGVIELDDIRSTIIMNYAAIWTTLYRREFLVQNEIWLNETPGASYQDTSFSILVNLLAKNCIYDSEAYYCYRRDNESSSVLSKEKINFVRLEMQYAVDYLKKHDIFTKENADLVLRKKIHVYSWNCMRLSDVLAEEFILSIQPEMREYENKLVETLNETDQKRYELLTGIRSIEEYRYEKKTMNDRVAQLLDWVHMGSRFVLVGAGKIGQKVLSVQEYVNRNFVDAVVDNGAKIIGSQVEDYLVRKVEDGVTEHPNHCYMIANKKHAADIQKQLISLGISSEKILCINTFPSGADLLLACMEYYK